MNDPAGIEQIFAGAVAHFGKIDVVVANAAVSILKPVAEAKWENVRRTIRSGSLASFMPAKLAAQQMLKQPINGRSRGKIVIICSVHEEIAFAQSAAYNMAKAAITHLGRTMAGELARAKINVNIINPGWIDTPGERLHFGEESVTEGGKHIPWGRITPEDIGNAVAFLASDHADYVTGAILRVDGGFVSGACPGLQKTKLRRQNVLPHTGPY